MAIFIAILLFSALMGAISYYGYRSYSRPGQFLDRLGTPVLEADIGSAVVNHVPEVGWIVRVIQQVGEKVPINPDDAGITQRDLIMAGYRSDSALKVFNGLKICLCILLVIFAFLVRSSLPN